MAQLNPSIWSKDQRVGSVTVHFANILGYTLGFFLLLFLDTKQLLLYRRKISFKCDIQKCPLQIFPPQKVPEALLSNLLLDSI